MARLALVTERFPFAGGEPFLDAELPYLARAFDEVVIRAIYPPADAPAPELPSNVRAIPLSARRGGRASRALLAPLAVLRDPQARTWFMAERPLAWRKAGTKGVVRLAQYLLDTITIRDALASRAPEDILYSYWCGPGAAALAMLKEREPRRRAIARGHGVDVYPEQWDPPYIPLEGRVLPLLDRVVLVSENGMQRFREIAPSARTEVRRLGVTAPSSPTRPSEDGVLRIVSCSAVVPVKRIDKLLSALAVSRAQMEWTHVGGGPGLASAEAEAKRLPANIRSVFTGQLPHDEVLRRYTDKPVDLFVNVSASEGLPVALAEAMRREVPAIAPRIGGIAELVDQTCGRLLPADPQPAEIAAALDAFAMLSADARVVMRRAAGERASSLMSAERNYPAFADWLRGLAP